MKSFEEDQVRPFGLAKACSKCGGTDLVRRYCPEEKSWGSSCMKIDGEHHHVRCNTCQFVWIERVAALCADCGRPYGDEHGFPDLIIEDRLWKIISPNGDGSGLLCPSCICHRVAKYGITGGQKAEFKSGPFCDLTARDGVPQ